MLDARERRDWAIPAAGDVDDAGCVGGGRFEDLLFLDFLSEVVEAGEAVVDAERLVWSGFAAGEVREER